MRICIVGNGASALNKFNGDFIDDCDEVVRIKNFQICGFEKHVGKKITMFSSKWFSWFNRIDKTPLFFSFLSEVNTLLFMFPHKNENIVNTENINEYVGLYKQLQLKNELPSPLTKWEDHLNLLNYFKVENKKLIYFTQDEIKELCCDILKLDKINFNVSGRNQQTIVEPTCGIRTIFKILKLYPNSEIFLTGFDGFQTSWYWNPQHKINSSHHYLTERVYLTHLKNIKRVVMLD